MSFLTPACNDVYVFGHTCLVKWCRSSPIKVYTVCYSISIFWKHYCTVKPHCSNFRIITVIFEPPQDKTNKMVCAPSEDSDQPRHPPSLIRVFTVHMKKPWFLSYLLSTQRRFLSDWADAQLICVFAGRKVILLVLS